MIKPTEKMKLTINVEYATHESCLAASQWESPSPRLPEQPAWTSMSQLESEEWQKLSSTEKNKALKTCFKELETAKTAFDQFEKQVVQKNRFQNTPLDNHEHINKYLQQIYDKSGLLLAKIDEALDNRSPLGKMKAAMTAGSPNLDQLKADTQFINQQARFRKDGSFINDIKRFREIYQRYNAGNELIGRYKQIKDNGDEDSATIKEFLTDLKNFNQQNSYLQGCASGGIYIEDALLDFRDNIWPQITQIAATETQAWRSHTDEPSTSSQHAVESD